MTQLSLLDWKPAPAILVFPLEKRVGKIRRVAELLEARHGAAAETYWRQTVATLAGQMERAGIDRETISQELRAFQAAVQQELCRRAGHGQRPGGSAA